MTRLSNRKPAASVPAGSGEVTPETLIAAVIGLIGVTAGSIYQKRFATGLDLRSAGACQFAGATAVVLAGALLTESGRLDPTHDLLIALAWSVIVLSIGAISLLMIMIREGAISQVTAYFYLVPPVTALMAWAAFGDTLAPVQIAGMALASIGVAIASRGAGR